CQSPNTEYYTSIIGLAQFFWFLLCAGPALRLPVSKAVYYDAAGFERPPRRRRLHDPNNDLTMSEAVRTMMRMDAEAAQETAAQADAEFLWDFWYPAVRSTEIAGQKLVTAMLLEVPL